MLETMICPNCAAPLTFSTGSGESMQCPYCHTIVRLSSQSTVASSAGIETSNQKKPSVAKAVALIVLLIGAPIAIIFVIVVGHGNPAGILSPANADQPQFATMTLAFGSKGITPGHFESASCISVDHQGHIYVGESAHGRVQVFDTTGKYLSEFSVGSFDDMVADRDGTLYVATDGKICRFNGATGAQLPDMERGIDDWLNSGSGVQPDPSWGLPAQKKSAVHYRCVCQTPGVIYAIMGYSVDPPGIVKLSATTGRVASVVRVTSAPDMLNLHKVLALSTGEIYGLDTEMGVVYKFSSAGAYLNKFGGASDEASSGDRPPSQLHWATSMASDSQGRVYISNDNGIKVYDKNGNYIGDFGDNQFPNGIAIDERDNIFACFNNCVREYVLQKH